MSPPSPRTQIKLVFLNGWRWKIPVACVAVVLLNMALAWHLLVAPVDRLVAALADGLWPFDQEEVQWSVRQIANEPENPVQAGRVTAAWDGRSFQLLAEVMGRQGGLACDTASTRVWMRGEGRGDFEGGASSLPEMRMAWSEMQGQIRGPRRWLAALLARPLITGIGRSEGHWTWRIHFSGGNAEMVAGWPERLQFQIPGQSKLWEIRMEDDPDPIPHPEALAAAVPADEIDAGLAEWVRILALQMQTVRRDADGEWTEGKGRLRIRNGHRMAYFEGSGYDIGYQHGRLMGDSARRLIHRTLFGIGLYYSLEKAEWFPAATVALFQRQHPFIEKSLLDEMRGFADGAEMPLELVQAVNLFPEFFHCTGVAVFGKATRDGKLYHARVLDYMAQIGLQDEAVIMAVRRDGAIPFVSIGYAGFLGSVTGMNAHGVAIGEMGGKLEGAWDGEPMSYLIRGMLENAQSLDEAIKYLESRPRTCEFYYIVSDAKGPGAVALHATPEQLEVIRPGETHPSMLQPMEDTIMVSSGSRYGHLVDRVRQHYGDIDADVLVEICKRPVAMKDNLHSVFFAPQELEIRVANAGRHTPACDMEIVRYSWPELFSGGVK